MDTQTTNGAIVHHAGEGDQYWFYGGGVWTWKARAESGTGLSLVEVAMDQGKMTPLHTHPIPESMWVLEGSIRYHIEGTEFALETGDYVQVPAGLPHAFMVVSDVARILSIQTSNACEAFYLGASEPLAGSNQETDFGRIALSGQQNGGFELVGPPPF